MPRCEEKLAILKRMDSHHHKRHQVSRQIVSPGFQLVTPGIRPADAEVGDQKRIMTPAEAIAAGSTHLVIGRPITQAAVPVEALTRIEQEIVAAR